MKAEFVEVKVGSVYVKLKSDDRIAQHILKGQLFEPNTLEFFGSRIQPGMVVLDIGCYSGLFSIAATLLGATAIGFEPFPPNQEQITINQHVNQTDFTCWHVALSDKSGKARFGHTAVHLTSGGSLERKGSLGIEVNKVRLDEMDFPQVDIIKMDVERHEPAVIRGAKLTIERCKPLMIVECNDADMFAQVEQEMGALGYANTANLDVRNFIFEPRV